MSLVVKQLKIGKNINRIASFTDIHFGKRQSSVIHNEDCLNFVKWFCNQVKIDGNVDAIWFLGDWFENRNSVNIHTLHFTTLALRELNALGLPILFCVGNHDLYLRNTRMIHSVDIFSAYENVHVIDHVTIVNNQVLMSPYLFKQEYDDLLAYTDIPVWAGHFEFNNFAITGYNTMMEGGASHEPYFKVKRILSGHFHKRQANDNVVYIGNTFPTDFGDSGDNDRGMTFYNINEDKMIFESWPDAPSYERLNLSQLMAGDFNPLPGAYVKCLVDVDLSYTEAMELRETMIETFKLRSFVLEEDRKLKRELIEDEDSSMDFTELQSIDEFVVSCLKTGVPATSTIDPQLLVSIYMSIPDEV